MMTLPDFEKKQIIFVFLNVGEKISFSNDNLVVKDKDDKTKLQTMQKCDNMSSAIWSYHLCPLQQDYHY